MSQFHMISRSTLLGTLGVFALLSIYFLILTVVSGRDFALVGASAFTAAYSRWRGEKGGVRGE